MRISDWSSDVCSSDLRQARAGRPYENDDLHRRPDRRLSFAVHDARARRHHHHRHPAGRRPGTKARALVSEGRRRRRTRYRQAGAAAPGLRRVAGMSGRFAGRTAVITGGASGLGKAVAARLVAEGGRVALWDLTAEAPRSEEAKSK